MKKKRFMALCVAGTALAMGMVLLSCDLSGPGDTGEVAVTIFSKTVGRYHNYSPLYVTFTFSEDVGGFTSDDVEIVNGSYLSFQSEAGSPSHLYSADIEPNGNGTVEISVPSGVAENVDGETNKASNIFSTNYQGFNHGLITDIIPSQSDDIAYAIDYSNGDILVIDITKPGIVNKVDLTRQAPVSAVLD